MCACTREKKRELGVVLLPEHQPVTLDMALPRARIVARQFVRAILLRQRAVSLQQADGCFQQFHIVSALAATFSVAAEGLGHSNCVHIQMPKDWNISLDEENVSTRPARMSSCERW